MKGPYRRKQSPLLRSIGGAALAGVMAFFPTSAGAQEAEQEAKESSELGEEKEGKFAEAKLRFKQGVALAEAGNCAGAISELEASYALVPRTNTLFNIAHCHEELFQYTLAVQYYEKFLAEADAQDPDRVRVEATIRSLKNLLGEIQIESNVEAEVWLGDRLIGKAPGKILIPGGRHVVELRSSGYLPARKELTIAGRESRELQFNLVVAQKKVTITKVKSRGLKPIYFWSGVAATGVSLAAGSYFGLRAKLEDTSARSIDSRLPRDQQADQIQTLARVGDVFFFTAGALAIGTTVTYFMTDWKSEEEGREKSVRFMPIISSESFALGFEGAL